MKLSLATLLLCSFLLSSSFLGPAMAACVRDGYKQYYYTYGQGTYGGLSNCVPGTYGYRSEGPCVTSLSENSKIVAGTSILPSFVGCVTSLSENSKIVAGTSILPSFVGGRRSSVFDPFSLDVWDPFKDFPFPSVSEFSRENSWFLRTIIDWKDTPEELEIKVYLPGKLDKDNVKLYLEQGFLWISDDKKFAKFRVPESLTKEGSKWSLEKEVLRLTLKKTAEEVPSE